MNPDEARQLRNRQSELANAIGRQREDEDGHQPSIIAVITGPSTWPPATARGPYNVKAALVTGGTAIGSTLSATAVGAEFTAVNLSPGNTPPNPALLADGNKTVVLATAVGGIYYFNYP